MYTVDERDRVHERTDVPQSSAGAPLPSVVANEHKLLLAYLVHAVDPAWDGSTVRMVGPDTDGEIIALVEFIGATAHMFGPPNDEAFRGHPLAARGLHPYGVFEIGESSWIRGLERMNRVHSSHNPAMFARRRHFVFAFHDSTFECVAEDFKIEMHGGSMASAVREMSQRVTQGLMDED